MIRWLLIVALFWAVILPPFFTHGACSAEFDRVSRQIQDDKAALASPLSAQRYWDSRHVPVQVISADQCRVSRPRFIDQCAPGDIVYAAVPVKSRVCRYYRDSAVRVQFLYDERGELRQLEADMDPYTVLSIPWLGIKWYWGG